MYKSIRVDEAAVDVRAVTHRDRTWGARLDVTELELSWSAVLTAAGRCCSSI